MQWGQRRTLARLIFSFWMVPMCSSEPHTPVRVATRMVLYGIIYLLAETCGSRNVRINPIQNYASYVILTAVVPFQSPTVTHRHQNSFALILVYYKILQLQTLWHHAGLINALIKHRQFCKEGHYIIHYCCRERVRMTNWQRASATSTFPSLRWWECC